MKKFLITIAPLYVILSAIMWIFWGLKGALAFFGIALFSIACVYGFEKWVEFVDKHVKD